MRRTALAMAALYALLSAGCQARGGEGWSPAAAGTQRTVRTAAKPSSEEEKAVISETQAEPDEEEALVRMTKEELEALAQELFDEGLAVLATHYTGPFDTPEELDIRQMCWSVYQVYRNSDQYKEEKQEHAGYHQMSKKQMDKFVERWFGPDAPDTTAVAKPEALFDPVSCELINYDEEKKMYYIFDSAPLIDEQMSELRGVSQEDGELVVRFNTVNAEGVYRYTYYVRLKPNDDQEHYYVAGLSQGKQSGAGSSDASEEEESGEDSSREEASAEEPPESSSEESGAAGGGTSA